jgi:hypothetical protein
LFIIQKKRKGVNQYALKKMIYKTFGKIIANKKKRKEKE